MGVGAGALVRPWTFSGEPVTTRQGRRIALGLLDRSIADPSDMQGGDTIVVRSRGQGGTSRDLERTLGSLGLPRIGSWSVGDRDQGWFWGQIEKVWHQVALYRSKKCVDESDHAGAGVMARSQGSSEIFHLGRNEFVKADIGADDGSVTLIWSSGDEVVQALTAVEAITGTPDGSAQGSILLRRPNVDGVKYGEGTSDEVAQFARESGDNVQSLSVELPGAMFAWRAPVARVNGTPISECSLVIGSLHAKAVSEVIEQTGSKRVAQRAYAALDKLHILSRLS